MESGEPLQDAVFEPILRPERVRHAIRPQDIEDAGGLSAHVKLGVLWPGDTDLQISRLVGLR